MPFSLRNSRLTIHDSHFEHFNTSLGMFIVRLLKTNYYDTQIEIE